jgi:hypothetical protein
MAKMKLNHYKLLRSFLLALCSLAVACVLLPAVTNIFADSKPNVQLNTDNVGPRELEDVTQKAVLRDYTLAWQALNNALANNTTAPLKDNFVGFALDKLTQRVKDQQAHDLKTKIIDHGHQVDAILYSRDGSAVQLRDTANLEIQVLDGGTVLHSEQAKVQYIAVMTGAADRWQVRVLEDAPNGQ